MIRPAQNSQKIALIAVLNLIIVLMIVSNVAHQPELMAAVQMQGEEDNND